MMRKLLIIAFGLFLLDSSLFAQDWYKHRDAEGRFTASLPTKPALQSFKQPIIGGEMEYHFFISQLAGGDQVFMVSYNDYPSENLKNSDEKTLLDACVHGAVESRQGKLLSEEKINRNGVPGRKSTFSGSASGMPVKVWHLCFLAENRLYQVMVLAQADNQPTAK